ncbi:GHKL domain-containing protein [candidate division WOR-3 bacterium]|nr:GHKL domain-containing protein [candidate division WOR-3 bacterium]
MGQNEIKLSHISEILKCIPTSLLIVDKNKNIIEANPSAKKLLGKNIESRTLDEIFFGREQDIFDKVLQGEIIQREKIELDNTLIGFSASPIYDNNSIITGASIILRDLTEIREIDESLRRRERLAALGEMTAGMAHEIRNPLAAIKAGIEYLSRDFKDDSKGYNYIKIILNEIGRLERIVKDMVAYASQRPSNKSKIDLKDVIETTLMTFQEQLREQDIKVKKYLKGELICMVDEDELVTVVTNLLLNALEAIEKDGTIEISGEEEKNNIKITLKDDGGGIQEDILPKIFNPFFTTKHRGTGLGLSIIHRIIQNHSGTINASNEKRGASFTITIPKGI